MKTYQGERQLWSEDVGATLNAPSSIFCLSVFAISVCPSCLYVKQLWAVSLHLLFCWEQRFNLSRFYERGPHPAAEGYSHVFPLRGYASTLGRLAVPRPCLFPFLPCGAHSVSLPGAGFGGVVVSSLRLGDVSSVFMIERRQLPDLPETGVTGCAGAERHHCSSAQGPLYRCCDWSAYRQ